MNNLSSLYLSTFNTSNVTNISSMFNGRKSLISLKLFRLIQVMLLILVAFLMDLIVSFP